MAWDKPGASNEEFERTKARCIMYAETNQMRNAWGGPFAHARVMACSVFQEPAPTDG